MTIPTPAPPETVKTGFGDLTTGLSRFAAVALAVFILWSVLVPLDSAVLAPGFVLSSGKNKVLQHRTGGSVVAIHVRDGQHLKKGDPLVLLDPVIDQAELTRLKGRQALLQAMKLRLDAEKNASNPGTQNLGFAPASPRTSEPVRVATNSSTAVEATPSPSALDQEQRREFEKGRLAVGAEIEATQKKSLALQQRRDGLVDRIALLTRQLAILERQLVSANKLVDGGHIAAQQAWDIETRTIDRRAELVNSKAELQSVNSGIAELASTVSQIKNRDARQTSQQLTEVLAELDQISDQLVAAESAIAEKQVIAQEAGTLVRWAVTTVGSVVKPGDIIGEIVPEGTPLEVQARVAPKDISFVHIGQAAKIKISALATTHPDPIGGEVVNVSADSSVDERTQERYFDVRVRLHLSKEAAASSGPVTVGMTGEVYLLGEPRTFASYVFKPIFDSFTRSFGEM